MRVNTAAGFTLIETLVALAVSALASALLIQGLQQAYRLHERQGHEIFRLQHGAMHADWYRRSIEELVPERPGGAHVFLGEPRQLRGISLARPGMAAQAQAAIDWQLRFDAETGATGLYQAEGGRESAAPVLSWPGDSGRFYYFDAEGLEHDRWPPRLGQWPQLPSAVHLRYGAETRHGVIVAVPLGPKDRPVTRKAMEDNV
jgi:prepilin-type N-terminal cleavage/methylation domain-containing protein